MFNSGSRVLIVAPSILSCKALRDRFLSGEGYLSLHFTAVRTSPCHHSAYAFSLVD